MAIDGKIKPTEDFWQNIACESIYGSSERVTKASDTLKTVIVYAFGLLSTGGLVLTFFGSNFKEYDNTALILFGVAVFFLTITYPIATEAQYPVTRKYNPNDVVEINTIFTSAVLKQTRIFRLAAFFTFLGFFLLALGILCQFQSLIKSKSASKPNAYADFVLKTGVVKNAKGIYIPVTIETAKNTDLTISLINTGLPEINEKRLLLCQPYKTDTSGKMYVALLLSDSTAKTLMVRVDLKLNNTGDEAVTLSKAVMVKVN